jgi:hypothetical protein
VELSSYGARVRLIEPNERYLDPQMCRITGPLVERYLVGNLNRSADIATYLTNELGQWVQDTISAPTLLLVLWVIDQTVIGYVMYCFNEILTNNSLCGTSLRQYVKEVCLLLFLLMHN